MGTCVGAYNCELIYSSTHLRIYFFTLFSFLEA
jgi:hypothetical protein